MPTREQIKERAKMTFRANYGNCVATYLIAMLLIGVASYTGVGTILVAIPLELGLMCYFLMIYQGAKSDLSTMFTTGFAINYGQNQQHQDIVNICVVVLLVFVCLLQAIGSFLARKTTNRKLFAKGDK